MSCAVTLTVGSEVTPDRRFDRGAQKLRFGVPVARRRPVNRTVRHQRPRSAAVGEVDNSNHVLVSSPT